MDFKLKFLILAIFLVLITANNKIKYLGDWDFDYYTKNSDRRWLILFYMDSCGYCRNVKAVFDTLDWDESTGYIAKLNCGEFRSTCTRFNINSIPQVYLIENNILYDYPQKTFSHETILKALTEPLDQASGRAVPPPESFYTTFSRDFRAFIEVLHRRIDPFIKANLNGFMNWHDVSYTIGLLGFVCFVSLMIVGFILKKLCNCCCGKRKKVRNLSLDPILKDLINEVWEKKDDFKGFEMFVENNMGVELLIELHNKDRSRCIDEIKIKIERNKKLVSERKKDN